MSSLTRLPSTEANSVCAPSTSNLHSCLYEGTVFHHRYSEIDHYFRYRVFQVYLDLDELSEAFQGSWLWSTNRWAVARFRRQDFLGDRNVSLKESVQKLVYATTGVALKGPIRLLTNLRYFGYQMNPVSFYYCFDETAQHVETVVAEVSNTPWGERHCYVLPWSSNHLDQTELTISKDFHVSPFFPLDMEYRWCISRPTESLSIEIQNYRNDELALDVGLSMRRLPLTPWNMNTFLLKYPSMTAKVILAIYWQALKLWWKGATYHPHPVRATAPETITPAKTTPELVATTATKESHL